MDPPTESDLPANESGSSTRPIRHYESEQMKEYRKKIYDIWTFHSLEEDSCNFIKWKKFFQGLPSTNFKQWDKFLNRYPDLKKLLESLKDEDDGSFEDEYSNVQKQLQHERGKAQTEANKLLTELNAVVKEGGKTFCGLETSPLNLETRKFFKEGSKYQYQPNVREYLLNGFPDVLKKDYCCPEPVTTKKKDKNRNSKHNLTEDQDNESKGVITVVRMFQELSLEGQTPSPMFILTNYQFPNIMKYVKDVKVSSQIGEFDIIVLSKWYSCFFIGEIKACKRSATNLTKCIFEANDQLFKYYAIIQETFRDRPDILELPVYDFIVIPFVDRCTLKKTMSKEFDDRKVLTEDDLQDQEAFTNWLGRTFPQVSGVGQHSSMDDDQYYTIVERFAGIGSEVEKTPPQTKTKEEGNFLFRNQKLTCVQEELVKSTHHLLAIAGDYGTGKSLTLVRRAIRFIECAQGSDIKVVMVSFADVAVSGKYVDKCSPEHMVHHLQHLLQKKNHEYIQVKTFSSFVGKCNSEASKEDSLESQEACLKVLTDAVETELKAGNLSLHLLFDEVPHNLVSQQYFKDFFKWLNEKKERVSVSMTIATHSYRVFNKDNSLVREVLPKDCMYGYLGKVQRTPRRVFNLQKEISSYCGDHHESELDNLWGGSMPLLYRVPDCSCLTENQAPFKPEPLSTPCVEGRLKCTLKQLFQDLQIIDEIGNVKKKDWPGKVVIIISAVSCPNLESQICGLLEQCCQQLKIRIKNELSVDTSYSNGDNTSQDDGQRSASVGDEILLTKETYYIGCERHVVICIDLNAMKHWFNGSRIAYSALAVSRSLSDYVHLTFQEEEASKMFKTNLKANEGLMSSEEINEAFRKSQEGKGCLQTVLDKQVIEEKRVNKPAEICNSNQLTFHAACN
ncbi:uncharacterized protein [Apostichopus japonicus]|uniref:uncharacterized protein isoform X2 n=1 Tax=Stichopus japonicus TaxID=307972 RepID=UPI003AB67577